MAKKKARSTQSYLNTAKANAMFAPSLRKYKRRKTLNRWEKAAITRKDKAIRAAGNVVSLSKKQIKALDNKDAVIGNGITAVALRTFEPGDKINVVDGQIEVRKSGRRWRYMSTAPEPDDLAEEAELQFDLGAKQVSLWTVRGRIGAAAADFDAFMEDTIARIGGYKDIDEWILGLAVLL